MPARKPDNELKRPRGFGFVLPLRCDFSVPETLAEAVALRGTYAQNVATLEAAEARQSESLRSAILQDRRECLEDLDIALGGVDPNEYGKIARAVVRARQRLTHYQAKMDKMESCYVK